MRPKYTNRYLKSVLIWQPTKDGYPHIGDRVLIIVQHKGWFNVEPAIYTGVEGEGKCDTRGHHWVFDMIIVGVRRYAVTHWVKFDYDMFEDDLEILDWELEGKE